MTTGFSVQTYSPSDVIVSLGGYQLLGWDTVGISRSSAGFITVRGIRGKHTRVPSEDTSATLTISLLQVSPSNDVLSEIHRQDLLNGTGRISLTLKDNSGNSVFSSDEAYIISYPETTFSGGFEYRTWNIFCQTTGSYIVGGNTQPETNVFNSIYNAVSNIF